MEEALDPFAHVHLVPGFSWRASVLFTIFDVVLRHVCPVKGILQSTDILCWIEATAWRKKEREDFTECRLECTLKEEHVTFGVSTI